MTIPIDFVSSEYYRAWEERMWLQTLIVAYVDTLGLTDYAWRTNPYLNNPMFIERLRPMLPLHKRHFAICRTAFAEIPELQECLPYIKGLLNGNVTGIPVPNVLVEIEMEAFVEEAENE